MSNSMANTGRKEERKEARRRRGKTPPVRPDIVILVAVSIEIRALASLDWIADADYNRYFLLGTRFSLKSSNQSNKKK